MNKRIEIRKYNKITALLLFLLAAYIQLGRAVFRIDAPIDMGLILVFALIFVISAKTKAIRIPNLSFIMILWGGLMFFSAICIAPGIVGHHAKLLRVGYEAVCLLCMILFMVVSFNIASRNLEMMLLKFIAYLCLINASLSVVSEVTKFGPFMKMFYLSGAGIRFQGISENPNDYMVQALVAFVYFYYSGKERKSVRLLSVFVLIFSALAAGSKGGLFAIAVVLLAANYEKMIRRIKGWSQKQIARCLLPVLILIVLLFVIVFGEQIAYILSKFNVKGIERIVDLLRDPMEGLNGSGSDRMITWGGTIKVFHLSPLIGVGIGGHKQILTYLHFPFAYETPHSIYLELLEQCGIIGGAVIGFCVLRFIKNYVALEETDKIVKGSFIILLLDGIFFASNWTATFWIIVGIMLKRAGSSYYVVRLR